jgi:hypothetical protein
MHGIVSSNMFSRFLCKLKRLMSSVFIWPLADSPLPVMDVILYNLKINVVTALRVGRVDLIIGKRWP